jgi:hypothetical protein
MRFGVRDGSGEAAIAAALDEAFAEIPRDSSAHARAGLDARVRAALDAAREADALDLYLPLLGVRGRPVPASMVVGERLLPAGDSLPKPEQGHEVSDAELVAAIVAELAASEGGSVVDLQAGPCARLESVAQPEGGPDRADEAFAARRIDYHLPVPHEPRRWVTVACSVADGLDPLTPMIVELFDAVVGTWRWQPAGNPGKGTSEARLP